MTAESYVVVDGDDFTLTCTVSGSVDTTSVSFTGNLTSDNSIYWSGVDSSDIINYEQNHLLSIDSGAPNYGSGTFNCTLDDYAGFEDSIQIEVFAPGKL